MVYLKLEKTDLEVLAFMVEDVSKEHSIKELAEILKRPYVKVHASIKRLAKKGIITEKILGKAHYCALDYKNNTDVACFVEAQKAKDFASKNKPIKIFLENIKEKLSFPDYTLAIFGSVAKGRSKKNSDLDLAVITTKQNLQKTERAISAVARITSIKIHAIEFTYTDFIEMLKSKELTVGKEILKNHIIIHGCDQFYRCIMLSQ